MANREITIQKTESGKEKRSGLSNTRQNAEIMFGLLMQGVVKMNDHFLKISGMYDGILPAIDGIRMNQSGQKSFIPVAYIPLLPPNRRPPVHDNLVITHTQSEIKMHIGVYNRSHEIYLPKLEIVEDFTKIEHHFEKGSLSVDLLYSMKNFVSNRILSVKSPRKYLEFLK